MSNGADIGMLRVLLIALACFLPVAASAQVAMNGVWRGTIAMAGGELGTDITVMSSDGQEFGGYFDTYPIGRGYQQVPPMCYAFTGKVNVDTGQAALILQPDPRVVAANGGSAQGIQTLSLAGRISGSTWTGDVTFVSAFRTFRVSKTKAPVAVKHGCLGTPPNFKARSEKRKALEKEMAGIEAEKAADKIAFDSITGVDALRDGACNVELIETTKEKLILEGLERQLLEVLGRRAKDLANVADWATKLYYARTEPSSPFAEMFNDRFLCSAEKTKARMTITQRRIVQEKRLAAIETELQALR